MMRRIVADGQVPTRFQGVRLPEPSPQEARGFPVTVYDAAGQPVATVTTAEWWARAPKCIHNLIHCAICVRLRHAPDRRTDAEVLAALAV